MTVAGRQAPRWGDLNQLGHDATRFLAVHQARQPLLMARPEDITHGRRADEPRRMPPLPFHGGDARRKGGRHLHIHHETRVRSAHTPHDPFGAGADTPEPFGGAPRAWSSLSRPAYTWESVPSREAAVASWGVMAERGPGA